MRERPSPIRYGLIGAALALLVGHALVFDFVNDDAFISFRYADNLVRHGELVFNPGERVEGYTNFLWTMVMAGVMALGLDPVPWSKWLGIACAAGTLLLVARFTGRNGRSSWDALAPALLAALPAYACWATGGLETALFTLLVTAGWTGYLAEREHSGFPWSGAWFALAAMTRPEGMLFFGLTGLHRLVMLVRARQWPERRDWLWGMAFAGLFAPYYAWRWWYYGWPFPNTYYVKTGASGFWKPGGNYVGGWLLTQHVWAMALLGFFARGHGRLLSLAALYTVVMCVHVASVGGDFMALYRFLVPVMPILAVVAALGVRGLAARLGAKPVAIAGVALAALLAWSTVRTDRKALEIGSEGGVDSIGWLAMFAEQTAAIGLWLRDNAPENASLATTAAGVIPYYSRLYTLDVLGLNDEWIAHEVPARGHRPGHTKVAPFDYVMRKEIDYLIYHPTIAARRPGPVGNYRRQGYEWKTVQVPGLEPDPPRGGWPAGVEPPPGWWGFWQRVRAR